MAFDTGLARLDQGFESQWGSIGIMCRVMFSGWKLSHGESKEVESNLTFMGMKCMGDSSFTGMKGQPYRCKPFPEDLLALLHNG